MNPLKAILVDDERHALDLFKRVLSLFDNNIQVVGEATDLPSALKLISKHQPSVVFLDIDMPVYSGLQIADFVDADKSYEIVFVTAHGKYAIDAIRISAFDYLLKPLDLENLKQCINRLNAHFEIKRLKKVGSDHPKKITLNSQKGTQYINIDSILYLEASAMYTIFHTVQEQYVVSRPLGEYAYLIDHMFYRVHRSFMVNTLRVDQFSNTDGNGVILDQGTYVPVSRSRLEAFKQFMSARYGL